MLYASAALCMALTITVNAKSAKSAALPILVNWSELPVSVIENKKPIVLLVEQSDCPYCERVKDGFLHPLVLSGDFVNEVHFMRISIDPGEYLRDLNNKDIETTEFCGLYDANFTPTVLFLDGQGKQITEKIVGISSDDYYGFYLERSIKKAITALQ
jgi:thioredoxin-related protein